MFKKVSRAIGLTATSLASLVFSIGSAVAETVKPPAGKGFSENLGATINKGLGYVLSIAGLIALFYIIAGGFTYLTSAGNPEKVGTAKNQIMYAFIGVVVIAASFALKKWVFSSLGITSAGDNITL
ncbi:hypothetical protein HYV44_01840 [Candidatus Microgenomates bacterium]|nr:hypothetical protein [Candidatus Microgenomates bacterium]